MAPEPQAPGSSMDTKQKAMIGIVAVVVIIILWQVVGLFGGSSAPSTSASKPQQASKTGAAMVASAPGAPGSAATGMPEQPQQMSSAPQEAPIENNSEILRVQKESEEKYLANINQLQMLKMQQQIAETNQAIASAKLATVTSEKNMADLLTKPAPVPVAENVYANNMAGTPGAGEAGAPPVQTMQAAKADVPYVVLSVAEQGYKWSAVVGGLGGKFYSVNTGDILKDDGSKILSIDRTGVVLEKDGKQRKITLNSSI